MNSHAIDCRSKITIAAKRTDMNVVGLKRRLASKAKEAEKLQGVDAEHIINIKTDASDLRNSAAFDPAQAPEGALMLRLAELGERHCKWPLYRDGETQLFCGCKTRPDKSYCEVHRNRAYLPAREVV